MYAICLKQHLLQICRLMPHLQAVVRAVVSKNRQKWPIPQVERKVKNYSCTIFVKKFTTLWDAPRKRTELKSRQLQGRKHVLLFVTEVKAKFSLILYFLKILIWTSHFKRHLRFSQLLILEP